MRKIVAFYFKTYLFEEIYYIYDLARQVLQRRTIKNFKKYFKLYMTRVKSEKQKKVDAIALRIPQRECTYIYLRELFALLLFNGNNPPVRSDAPFRTCVSFIMGVLCVLCCCCTLSN